MNDFRTKTWLTRAGAALLATLTLAACGGGDGDGIACTLEVRPSVMVTAVDDQGRTLTDVRIDYRLNGGALRTLQCEAAPCAVGQEEAGSFSLTATKAGHAQATATVVVPRDLCHVQTQAWRPTLRRL
ncbi:MAG: hypothetical protein JNM08_14345 [Rubrivivax sp.]|nr:hypothetical protein [Rubrivivax sp.]